MYVRKKALLPGDEREGIERGWVEFDRLAVDEVADFDGDFGILTDRIAKIKIRPEMKKRDAKARTSLGQR